jgi:ssDNA-binding Zn-finger/Zn-ribbon topoisomerase 1
MTTQICPKCGKNGMTWYIDHEVSRFTLWRCALCSYHAEENEDGMVDCPRCDTEKACLLIKDHEGFHRWCHRCGLFDSTDQTF